MISQTIAKPSFTKSKAFGLCGTLAIATALLIGAGSVSADEVAQPVADIQPAVSNVYTADNAGNVTVTPSETVVPTETPVATTEVAQPIAETPVSVETTPVAETPAPVETTPAVETPAVATETPVAQPVAETTAPVEAQPTTFVKEGDTIQVSNPNVEVDQSQGTGKYQGFTVEYKDVKFPDDMAINEGDKVKFTLPEEVKFQTNFDFDVYNPDKQVVGKATTDTASNTVTTVFNNYFASHPLNKQMSLKMDATWTDKVESGKPVTVNFNGTVITVNIGKEQEIGKDELLSKWGSQDENDPTVINWTVRLNYAKRLLNYVTIIDEMSDNQTLVDNFFEVKNIESVNPWIDKGSAMDLVKSISKSEHGFEIKMDRLDHMIYLNYKTKLTNAVKDSVNPTNKVELKAESDGAVSYSYVQLVGGRGDASGENKPEPTFEIPREAPKVDIPEFEGGIPGIPEVRELPEWNGGTVPNEAPVHYKPEFQGGIPGIPEVRELPPFEGGVVPNDAPILDLPELHIPEEPTPEKPAEPKKAPSKPVDAPKTKEVEITEVVYKNDSEPNKAPKTTVYGGTLPVTGEKEGIASTLGLVVIAAGITALTLGFKKHNECEE